MDDDHLTQQRAMDAAAAVAVAAAAAAHQTQHHQQQRKRVREDSDLDQKQEQRVVAGGSYAPSSSLHADQMVAAEAVESVRNLQRGDETFTDESMQYVQPDINGQNGESQSTSIRPSAYHTKRRKVNTCLPCKRRKVKCDREKPYCGQCKKHNFPASECTWSAASAVPSPGRRRNDEASGIAAVADAAAAAVTSAAGASNSASQWYEMGPEPWGANFPPLPVDQSAQALASRVAELEAADAELAGDARQDAERWDAKSAVMSEAERGLAADALAMISQQEQEATTSSSSEAVTYKGKRLLPSSGTLVPAAALLGLQSTSSAQTRSVVALLPDIATVRRLVADFTVMQEYGLDTGINKEVLNDQMDLLQSTVEKSNGEGLNLPFIALLFYLLAFVLEMKDNVSDVSLPELSVSPSSTMGRQEMITRVWSGAGQALLTILEGQNDSNLYIIMALSLKHHYLLACGKSAPARSALMVALSLCDSLNLVDFEEESGSGFFEEARPPSLLQQSARKVFRSLIAQYSLREDATLIRLAFDMEAAGSKSSSQFSDAVFDIARDSQEASDSHVNLQGLEERWSRFGLLNEGRGSIGATSTSVASLQAQSTILRMLAGHQLARLRRKHSLATTIESAHQMLLHRRKLEEQDSIPFRVDKVAIIQQATIEAAFKVALALRLGRKEDGEESHLEAEMRKELDVAISYLTLRGQRQSHAQRLLRFLLEEEGKISAIEGDGLEYEGALSEFLDMVCSGDYSKGREILFWKYLAREGLRLIHSSGTA